MKVTTVEQVLVPTGEYLAEAVEIEQDEGNFGPQFKWKFDIVKPEEYAGTSLVGWTSTSPSLKGKFVKWASACLGRSIKAGETIDTRDLIGERATLVVTVKEGDDGAEFNKIDSIKPLKKAKPAPKAQAEEDSDDEDPFGEE